MPIYAPCVGHAQNLTDVQELQDKGIFSVHMPYSASTALQIKEGLDKEWELESQKNCCMGHSTSKGGPIF